MSRKEKLINDIENLLNNYNNLKATTIDTKLLEFMDENTLVSIIDSLLIQKEESKEADTEWLAQFKKDLQ